MNYATLKNSYSGALWKIGFLKAKEEENFTFFIPFFNSWSWWKVWRCCSRSTKLYCCQTILTFICYIDGLIKDCRKKPEGEPVQLFSNVLKNFANFCKNNCYPVEVFFLHRFMMNIIYYKTIWATSYHFTYIQRKHLYLQRFNNTYLL